MQNDDLQDIGGGVSVFMPADTPLSAGDDDGQAARTEAFLKLSQELAQVSSSDPLSISPVGQDFDPHLDFFMKNKA